MKTKKLYPLFAVILTIALATMACSLFTSTTSTAPTAVSKAAEATAVVNSLDNGSAIQALDITAMVPFPDIKDNMDIGDPAQTSLVYAKDSFGSCFVSIIATGKNLDFESAQITGKFLLTTSSLDEVAAAGDQLSTNTGCKYKLYVGDEAVPAGWTKEFPAGWKMDTSFTFTEKPIDAGPWYPVSVSLSDTPTWTAPSDSPMYCQLWHLDAKHLYHFFLEPGDSLTTIVMKNGKEVSRFTLQGTCFTMQPGENLETIKARAAQMTSIEVANRDATNGVKPIIEMMYVGNTTPMNGWTSTLLTGWTATKN